MKARKANYKTTFRCDRCNQVMNKEETIFTHTSYGGKAWLCKVCGIKEGYPIERLGVEE